MAENGKGAEASMAVANSAPGITIKESNASAATNQVALDFGTGFGFFDVANGTAFLEEDCEAPAFLKAHPDVILFGPEQAGPSRLFWQRFSRLPAVRNGGLLVVNDAAASVFAWVRKAPGARPVAVICNMTPQLHDHYRLPLPHDGQWREVINSDAEIYGGSGKGNCGAIRAEHGGANVVLPPLATLMFEFEG